MREVAMMKWFLDKCLEIERVDHVSFLIPEIHERVKLKKGGSRDYLDLLSTPHGSTTVYEIQIV
jgi:hypothetical protein